MLNNHGQQGVFINPFKMMNDLPITTRNILHCYNHNFQSVHRYKSHNTNHIATYF